ncbi:hypothetical protein ACJ3XI_11235 [Litorimonas sp. RW-G-Af-16]|uniref:hypothetical protein n=1 Tax=Litorimonas sp. RW-G-Af-16 TaxID=3241168 RepID=UPI00390CD967
MSSKAPLPANTPVIIGVGQYQTDVAADLLNAPGPVNMAAEAVRAAVSDTGVKGVDAGIDWVFGVRLFGDSGPVFPCPFGRAENFPAAVATASGIAARHYAYDMIGGQTPQTLIAEAAELLEGGEAKAVLICGGEAIANMKAAMRAGAKPDWSMPATAKLQDRGLFGLDPSKPPLLVTPPAMSHQVFQPLQCYTLLENARRARLGLSRRDYLSTVASWMSGLAQTAQANPFAMFKDVLPEGLAIAGDNNPYLTDIYPKDIGPKDSVNQGAAVILTTYQQAQAWGVDPAKFIYLHAHADGTELPILERPHLDRSPVLTACIEQALAIAGVQAKDVARHDLYSCFPIVVYESAKAFGLDMTQDNLTLTGGLAFFGGPGNNYSLHAIADMVTQLRVSPQSYGAVYANGGFMSKHAVGIYSALPPKTPTPILRHLAEDGPKAQILGSFSGTATIESYCVTYKRGEPHSAVIIGQDIDSGARLYAHPSREGQADLLTWLVDADPIGQTVTVTADKLINYFTH